jgi:fatty acid synthase subunit alpha
MYLRGLDVAAQSGLTFQNKTALLTGTGAESIGAKILEGLISGGARVIATTSSFSKDVLKYYKETYAQHGSRESQLIVLPFNQGSKQDVEGLIDYIYNTNQGRSWDLDYIVPFAAISENGNEIDNIDSASELAHRAMLTNLLRLLGNVKRQKCSKGYRTRPAQVILPLSPNHGTFGGDGLYAESKITLETLFNKWRSESWSEFLTICGASIGWTRGTGLMSGNNIIAEDIETLGARTFSQEEMAFNILGLMTPTIKRLCETQPVYANLTGSVNDIADLEAVTRRLRKDISEKSELRKALHNANARETTVVKGIIGASLGDSFDITPRANIKLDFPRLPDYKTDIAPMGKKLERMVDLERVVVVTGFAELGPWGNSRTRWEMEAYGTFSLEGCIEMAWIMGLIKHHNGPIKGREGVYSGWIDSKTEAPVDDDDVKSRYEKHILEHSGIRLLETGMLASPDTRLLQEVVVEEDLRPFETSKEIALEFKRQQGEKAEILPLKGSSDYSVHLKSGAIIMVPKAPDYDQFVAAQVPTGWDARQYGISEDVIFQVDRVTLYALVCTAEALLSAGVVDPYEFYHYVHVFEVGNCIGSGFGGADSLRAMYIDRTLDKAVQSDILQETFINTIGAWVNMLLISSAGPLKTPVGACATAVESLNIGYDTIINKEAKVCLVGAAETYHLNAAVEFANMKATNNRQSELNAGRAVDEMSRPTTTTRNGFVESEGSGIQIITTAKLALEMGLPIYGIVALTATASDKIGRSVPAPGQGILTIAREEHSYYPSPLLDICYRKEQLEIQLCNIKRCQESAIARVVHEVSRNTKDEVDTLGFLKDRIDHIQRKFQRERSNAADSWGNTFWKDDPSIAPLRGALATWGLTIDDLDVVSLHGTSTVANDKNESDVISKELHHLGRTRGHPILGICQKYLTGHPKGPAGAWMFNGALQVLNSGLIPGNQNADNIDKDLEVYDLLLCPSRRIRVDEVKAFLISSFGFGQKSAQAVGVHPKYLFATLDEASYDAYKARAQVRQKEAYRHFHRALITNTLFRAKEEPPYVEKQESEVLLSPNVRATVQKDSSFAYAPQPAAPVGQTRDQSTVNSSESLRATNPEPIGHQSKTEEKYKHLAEQLQTRFGSGVRRVGIDIEDVETINMSSETFIARNFTPKEREYCRTAPSPQQSFAGRWSAKEAVFKSLGLAGKGAGAAMNDIEIVNDANGAPLVTVSTPFLYVMSCTLSKPAAKEPKTLTRRYSFMARWRRKRRGRALAVWESVSAMPRSRL